MTSVQSDRAAAGDSAAVVKVDDVERKLRRKGASPRNRTNAAALPIATSTKNSATEARYVEPEMKSQSVRLLIARKNMATLE